MSKLFSGVPQKRRASSTAYNFRLTKIFNLRFHGTQIKNVLDIEYNISLKSVYYKQSGITLIFPRLFRKVSKLANWAHNYVVLLSHNFNTWNW